ncbi:MAG: FAD-binding oxidoreductase [Betaproteobacteria bacterium]|nr:FAD-binding oxidoreductase [Betaproteobacteria bacterium]
MNETDHLIRRLRSILAPGDLLTDPADLEPFLVDWRRRLRGDALCVALPRTTGEVSDVVRACVEAGVAIVPQGGNTGLCGGATPQAGDKPVVVSLKRMNRVRSVDKDNNTITVEAGCILEQVQQAAEDAGRLFPLSLGAEGSCMIGGNLSTNAGGVHVLRYGNTRDLTLGLEVVLPDGRVWNGLRALRKDNTGYDLKQLFVGGEGTLGIITAAVLKLFPQPKANVTAWVGLPDPGAAVQLLGAAQEALGARLTAFELIADLPLALALRHIEGTQSPLAAPHPWHVLIEATDSDDEAALQTRVLALLERQLDAGILSDAVVAQNVAQARSFWHLREHIPEAQTRAGYSIKHDISVPISRIPEFLLEGERALVGLVPGIRIVPFGHLGDGNLHYNMTRPESWTDEAFSQQTGAVNGVVHELVHRFDGSISAEHGLGQVKRDEAARYKSEVELDLMRALKRAFDPALLMNPGKVLRLP